MLIAGTVVLHGLRSDGDSWRASDAAQHVRIAFNLIHYGTFHDTRDLEARRAAGSLRPYARREPGYPWYLAAILAPFADSRTLSHTCLVHGDCAAARPSRQRVHFVTAVVIMATAATVGSAIRAWTGSRALAISGVLCFLLLQPSDTQSVLASAFLLVHALLAAAAWRRPRIRTGMLSGLALGGLVLTKASFQYWLAGVAAFWIAAAWRAPGRRRATFPAFAALCAAAWIVTLPWMARNAATVGHFGISSRAGEILAIRAEYGRMTWSELRGAFAYWWPFYDFGLRTRLLRRLEPTRFGYTRFDRSNPSGFYRRARNLSGDIAARADSLSPGWRFGSSTARDEVLERVALSQIANDWPKHAALTVAFALRGSRFRESVHTITARVTAVWGGMMGAVSGIVVRAAHVAGMLFLPALALLAAAAWRGSDAALGFLILPALQGFALHAAATHFIPRYAAVFAPIAAVVIMLLIHAILRMLLDTCSRRCRIR